MICVLLVHPHVELEGIQASFPTQTHVFWSAETPTIKALLGQAKQVMLLPLPTMIEPIAHPQVLLVAFQTKLGETQLHEKEVALVVVKAVALLQVKHTKVLPVIIIALPAPQSQ